MDEKKEETKTEGTDETKDDSGDGAKAKTIETLDRADEIAERQKRENDRREELISRDEQLEARKAVGGETEAGKATAEKKEESPKEYNDRIEKEMSEGKHGD